MRQRHVARAEAVEHAQRAERAVDRMPAFHADERRDLALLEDALDVIGGQRQLECLGVLAHHAVDDVDLLERRRHGRRIICRDVDRPELTADAARTQAGDVGHDRGLRFGDVELVQIAPGILSERPRVVVVPVDEWHLLLQLPRARQKGRVALLRLSGGDQRQGEDECERSQGTSHDGIMAHGSGLKAAQGSGKIFDSQFSKGFA